MNNSAFVAKIGGERALEFESNARNIIDTDDSRLNMRIVSAMRDENFNTTTHLTHMVELLKTGNKSGALDVLRKVQEFHHDSLTQKIPGFSQNSQMQKILVDSFKKISQAIDSISSYEHLTDTNDNTIGDVSLTCFGDDLSAKLIHEYYNQQGGKGILVDPYSIYVQNAEEYVGAMKQYISALLESGEQVTLFTSGHGAVYANGIVNEYGRGYSDPTASKNLRAIAQIIGKQAFKKITLNAQKSVAGLLSIDPREPGVVNGEINPFMHEKVSVDLSMRLISPHGPHAGVLNSSSVGVEERELLLNDSRVNILISDPDNDSAGTQIIGKNTDAAIGPQFIMRNSGVDMDHPNANTIFVLGENLGFSQTGSTNFSLEIDRILQGAGIHDYNQSDIPELRESLAIDFSDRGSSDLALRELHSSCIEQNIARVA